MSARSGTHPGVLDLEERRIAAAEARVRAAQLDAATGFLEDARRALAELDAGGDVTDAVHAILAAGGFALAALTRQEPARSRRPA